METTGEQLRATLRGFVGIANFALQHDAITDAAALLIGKFSSKGSLSERDVLEAFMHQFKGGKYDEADYVRITNDMSFYHHGDGVINDA